MSIGPRLNGARLRQQGMACDNKCRCRQPRRNSQALKSLRVVHVTNRTIAH